MRLLITSFALFMSVTALAGPRVYVFDCGYLGFDDVEAFGISNDETEVREMFVPCYLVEHEQGRMLFDAGLPLTAVGEGDIPVQPGAFMRYDRSLLDQLKDLSLTPDDIDYLALSHHHFDHSGAANAVANATVLIQSEEHSAAFEHAADYEVFQPELYQNLTRSPMIMLSGDYDVFGDRSVMLVSAPGHTPGHQVLRLTLENLGPLMITGDLYHFRANRALRRAPVFNTDPEQTLRSMEKIEAMITRDNATLWIEHDMALARTLNKAPAYYD